MWHADFIQTYNSLQATQYPPKWYLSMCTVIHIICYLIAKGVMCDCKAGLCSCYKAPTDTLNEQVEVHFHTFLTSALARGDQIHAVATSSPGIY